MQIHLVHLEPPLQLLSLQVPCLAYYFQLDLGYDEEGDWVVERKVLRMHFLPKLRLALEVFVVCSRVCHQ
jgi:hypothetical protein